MGPDLTTQSALEAGTSALQRGDLDAAQAAFTAALRQAPRSAPALAGLGQCARRQGDRSAALARFQEAAAAEPGSPWFRCEIGLELRMAGRMAEAEAAYQDALRLRPGFANALIGLALCARERGDRQAALDNLTAAAAAEPERPWLQAELGTELRLAGRIDDAAAAFATALRLRPGLPQALLGLAFCERERGNREAALLRFTEAAAAEPDNAGLQMECATELREAGRFAEAEAAYAEAVRLRPGFGAALVGLGLCARRRGARAEALDWFQQAAQAQPGSIPILLELAAEHRELGDLDAAAATARNALAQDQGSAEAWMSLGFTERRAGRLAEARAAFTAAAELRPAALEPRLELADTLTALGETAAAEAVFEAAGADGSDAPTPLAALARLRRLAGRHIEAIAIGRRANAAAPTLQPALATVVESLLDLERAEEAVATLSSAATEITAPERHVTLEALRILALCRAGRIPEAVAVGRDAMERFPGLFAIWHAWSGAELRLGDAEAIAACIAAAPPRETSGQDHAYALCLAEAAELAVDHAGAERHLRDALASNPAASFPHDLLARLALRRWDAPATREHLQEAARRLPGGNDPARIRSRVGGSLPGQILEEADLTPGLAASLAAALALPDDDARIDAVAAVLRANPNATAPAMALLVALRRKAPLISPPATAPAAPIPWTIGQYAEETRSPTLRQLLGSWEAHHPGFAFRRFDLTGASRWLAQHGPAGSQRAFLRAQSPTQRADILRLAWLAAEGGIWIDVGSRCHAPLDATILPPGAALVGVQEDLGSLGAALIAAPPGMPLIRSALADAMAAMERGDAELPWLSTGPGLLTRALARAALQEGGASGQPRLPPGMVVYDRRTLLPHAAFHLGTSPATPKRPPAPPAPAVPEAAPA